MDCRAGNKVWRLLGCMLCSNDLKAMRKFNYGNRFTLVTGVIMRSVIDAPPTSQLHERNGPLICCRRPKQDNSKPMDFFGRFTSLFLASYDMWAAHTRPRSCVPSCSRLLIFQREAEKRGSSLFRLCRGVAVLLWDKNSSFLCSPAKEVRRSWVQQRSQSTLCWCCWSFII